MYLAEEEEVHRQLWLACAGPMANVPRVGDKVFYFPQGHIEQVLISLRTINRFMKAILLY